MNDDNVIPIHGDDIPEVMPERAIEGAVRRGLVGQKVPVSDLVTLEELQAAYEDDGETGMYRLIMERLKIHFRPRPVEDGKG